MANKKYTDFPPGTYDPTKILLQADPITGALEKINLQQYQNATQMRYALAEFQTNAAGTPTNLYPFTIPANTLVNNGDYYEMKIFFDCWQADPAATIDFFFGSVTFNGYGLAYCDLGEVTVRIFCIDSTHLFYQFSAIFDGVYQVHNSAAYDPVDFTQPIDTYLTINSTLDAIFEGRVRSDILYPAA